MNHDTRPFNPIKALLFTLLVVSNVVTAAVDEADDYYTTDEDVALIVPAPGVLANDSSSLPVFSVTGISEWPQHGTVTIAPDGSFEYVPEADYFGEDEFKYIVEDAEDTSEAVVKITINPMDEIPEADPQSISTDEDVAVGIVLTGSDPQGDPLDFTVTGGPTSGVLSGAAPNLTYTPDADFHGADSFTFTVSDGTDVSLAATVSITVGPVNDAPVADAQTVTTDEDTAIGITLTGSDVDGDALDFTVTGGPTSGVLSGTAPNLTYTPNADFRGVDSFTFTVSDGTETSPAPTVNIMVEGVNDAPVADAQAVTTDEDTAVGITLTGSDVDGDALDFTVTGGPASGTLSGTAPNLVYTPNAEFHGADSFTFTVSDGTETSPAATVSITVDPVNDAPVTGDVAVTTDEDTAVAVTLPGSDVDGDALTFAIVSGPASGTLSGSGNTRTYTPNPDFNGADSFTFTVSDGTVTVGPATVSITVGPVNDAPVANAQAVTTDEDTAVGITLTGSDIDADPLTYAIVSPPANGALSGTAPNLTYTPNADFHGADSFTFTVADGTETSLPATVSIAVGTVNDAPVTGPVAATTDEDTAVTVTLPGSDVDGDALTFTIVSGPASGTLSGSGNTQTYTPNPDFEGPDSFTFTVSDGTVTVGPVVASITVQAVNDRPVATAQSLSTSEDTPIAVILAASDVDGDALTYAVVTPPANGALSGTPPNLTYTPGLDYTGADAFEFTASDGSLTSVPATVSITVTPENDAPVVVAPIGEVRSPEDGPDVVIDIAPVFDDPDIATDGDSLTFALVGVAPDNPSLFDSESFSGSVLTLDPAADQYGTATVTVSATDSYGASVEHQFTVVIESVNDEPGAVDDTATLNENAESVTIAVLANDYLGEQPTVIVAAGSGGYSDSAPVTILDALGDPITWPDGSNQNGRITIVDDQLVYEPKPHFHGTDTFTYTIRDRDGDESTATVTVTVTPVNSQPQAPGELSFTMQEGGSITVDASTGLLVTAYDPDNAMLDAGGNPVSTQALYVQLLSPPSVGTLDIDILEGTFTYTPPTDFSGSVTFTYVLTDGEVLSEPESVVRIVVTEGVPPPEPPTPGLVAATYNLANFPLEQSTGVPSNVLVMMDDSGSMDWHMLMDDSNDGVMFLSNNTIATRSRVTNQYSYLYGLANNTYGAADGNGRILPTEAALQASANHLNNRYGVWRARNHLYNSLYYNPAVRYVPWVGQDNRNNAFGNANPSAARLDPIDPTRTINILNNHTYTANAVPRWVTNGGTDNLAVTVYIPHYYTTTATPPLAWNAANTLVEIRAGMGPLAGGNFPGGQDRLDCAGDGDPGNCTYAEEIQNFANWFQYYRSREYVAKSGMGSVISQVQDLRVGYETINQTRRQAVQEMNELPTEGNKKTLLDTIYSVSSANGTPLRQALDEAGQILGCEDNSRLPCPRMAEPAGFCQQNFTLLFTDGYWNGAASSVTGNRDTDGAGPFDGGRYADAYSSTLADTAMYHYERDIHDDYLDLVPVTARDTLGAPDGTFDDDAPFMHQHMKTYAIAFGVEGNVDPDSVPDNPATAFAWPDPVAGSQQKIDDLLHAAVNGRGRFLNAANSTDLQAALEAAFLEFTQTSSSTSSAAFNSTSLEEGTLLYRGFYDLRFNTGELTATRVNADGSLASSPLWRASEELDDKSPGSRVIVTYDPLDDEGIAFRPTSLTDEQRLTLTADQVEYLRGDRSEESPDGALRARQTVNGMLGDIVNSSPVFVGAPRSINRDQSPYPVDDLYSEFARDVYDRTPLLYVGANDGMLHGFDARTGEERFAYVPNKLIDGTMGYRNELSQFTSPFYQHRLFVDLTPRFNDAYVRTPSNPTAKSWRTILVGGLGVGGKGFYALDVTDPSLYASESAARNAVMWEFTDEDDTYPVDSDGNPLGGSVGAILDPLGQPVKDLGHSLSLPTIAMSNTREGGSSTPREWVALFGNGPNSTSGLAKLFVLFVDRGIDGWDDGDFVKIDTGYGVPLSPHPLTGLPNGLGTPTAVDTNLDGTVDRVYAGDRLGNLFRFDLSDPDPSDWTSTRLFTASYTTGGANTIQPILSQPTVIRHPTEEGFLVIFGTGSYMAREDMRSEDIQSIYAIWDRGENSPATAADDSRERRLVKQTLSNIYDDSTTPNVTRRVFLDTETVEYVRQNCALSDCSDDDDVPGVYGWYVDLDMPRATTSVSGAAVTDTAGRAPPGAQFPGERAVRRFVVRNGNLVTTTVLPALDEFSCFGTRPGAILVLSALTGGDVGEPLIDFNNDGVIDEGDLLEYEGAFYSGGLLMNQEDLDGQLVDLSTLGGAGGTDFLFVSGGRDTIAYLIEGVDDRRTGRLSWRELDTTN